MDSKDTASTGRNNHWMALAVMAIFFTVVGVRLIIESGLLTVIFPAVELRCHPSCLDTLLILNEEPSLCIVDSIPLLLRGMHVLGLLVINSSN